MPARDSGAPWRGSQLTRQAPAKHKGRFYAALIDTGSDIFAIRPGVAKAKMLKTTPEARPRQAAVNARWKAARRRLRGAAAEAQCEGPPGFKPAALYR
jgi:hypothetical protein